MKSAAFIYFLFLLVIIPVCFSYQLEEPFLISKYLPLSFLLFTTSIYLLFKKADFYINKSLATLFFFAYLICSCFSIFSALNIADAIFELSELLLFFITFLFSVSFFKSSDFNLKKTVSLLAIMATLICILFSAEQFINAIEIEESFSSTVYLITGLQGHKNLLSIWLFLLIPLTALGLDKSKYGNLCFFTLIVQVLFILLLQTKSVYLGLGVVLLFAGPALFFKNKSLQLYFNGILIFFVIAILGVISCILFTDLPSQLTSNLQIDSASAKERILLWTKTIEIIKENSLIGVGGENWKLIFPSKGISELYRAAEGEIHFIRPHNDFLWIWVEHGLFSILAYLGVLLVTIKAGFKAIISQSSNKNELLILLAGLFGYITTSFFSFPKERVELQIGFVLILALIIHFAKSEKWFSKKTTIYILISCSIFCLLTSYFGYKRYNIEFAYKKIEAYKNENNFYQVHSIVNKNNWKFKPINTNGFPVEFFDAIACGNLNKVTEMENSFLTAINYTPNNTEVLKNTATVYFLKKEYQKSISLYSKCVQINSFKADYKLNLASAYLENNQLDSAQFWLTKITANSERKTILLSRIANKKAFLN